MHANEVLAGYARMDMVEHAPKEVIAKNTNPAFVS
jgi:hypothetical protein